jgi:hypothetical protein
MPSQPQQPISDRRLVLLKTAQSLSEGKEKPAARHRLIYRISGGPPGKRFEQKLEIDGSGDVTLETKDGLSDERVRRAKQKIARQEIASLFTELVNSRLLENVDTGGGFLPDSMIGTITFDDGTRQVSYYFLADEQQRRQQGKDLNPSLQKMTAGLEATVQALSGGGKSR